MCCLELNFLSPVCTGHERFSWCSCDTEYKSSNFCIRLVIYLKTVGCRFLLTCSSLFDHPHAKRGSGSNRQRWLTDKIRKLVQSGQSLCNTYVSENKYMGTKSYHRRFNRSEPSVRLLRGTGGRSSPPSKTCLRDNTRRISSQIQ